MGLEEQGFRVLNRRLSSRIVQENVPATPFMRASNRLLIWPISQTVLIADEAMGPGLHQQLEKGLGVPVKGLDWDPHSAIWRRDHHGTADECRITGDRRSGVGHVDGQSDVVAP